MFRGLTVAASLLCLLSALPAWAGGRVLTATGSSLYLRSARVAQARAPQWTTGWLSVEVDGGPGRFIVVLPAPAGARVDPALDAFFSALDAATAPRVRPPKPVLACGATSEGSLEDTSQPFVSTLDPVEVAVLDDLTAVDAFASQKGVSFGADDAAALGPGRFAAVVFDLTQGIGRTETLRVVVPVAGTTTGLALLASADVPDVTLFSITEGRAALGPGIDEIGASALAAEWKVLPGTSNYVAERRGYLLSAAGGVALIEASGGTPLFGWNVLPSGAGALPPGVKTYFEKAKKEGAGIVSSDLCAEPVWDAVASGKTGARVSRACAPGALVAIPDAPGAKPCDETPLAGQSSASALRCGDADDLAYAFAGMRVDTVRVTRHATVAGPATPSPLEISPSDGPTVSLLVTAASADTSGCVNGNAGASGSGGTTGGAGYGGYGGGGGYAGGVDYGPDPVPEPDPRVDVSCWVEFADSCSSGSSDGSGDSCSSDSSSETEGDTCSGDSSSSDAEGESCSGDSSQSPEGDTCSGDSSSGAEGDTCSGDSGGGGESCSSGSSSSGGDCAVPRRPLRMRVSALFLLFAAVALPLRRSARRPRRAC